MLFINSILALLSASQVASAQNWKPMPGPAPIPIQVEVMRTQGPGCPAGTISATLSPDSSTLSVLFDQLGVNVPGSGVLVQEKKYCMITLGIKFPGQYRIAIVGSDVRGFVGVPAGARGGIRVQHWSIFGGPKHHQKMKFERSFVGPHEENVFMQNRFSDTPLWSYCGTQMRQLTQFLTISIEVSGENSSVDDLITAIDSFDFSTSPLSYQLVWTYDKKCPKR